MPQQKVKALKEVHKVIITFPVYKCTEMSFNSCPAE